MRKKNSEIRFHSPAAKITPTAKLPRDFFTPSKSRPTQNCPSLHNKQQAHLIEDAMLLTFRRTSSQPQLAHLPLPPSKSTSQLQHLPPLRPAPSIDK